MRPLILIRGNFLGWYDFEKDTQGCNEAPNSH